MSELSPNYDLAASMQAAPLAFCSLNGRQQGELFPLNMAKAILQFESASGSDPAPPTRCLVIQGLNGVTVRTVEGDVSINEQPTKDAWLTVGDEITCGSARLRLVRVQETQPPQIESPISAPVAEIAQQDNAVHSDSNAQLDNPALGADKANSSDSGEACESFEYSFFGRLEPTANPDEAAAGSATMCVNQEELRALLNPTVHGTEEPDYVQAAPAEPVQEFKSDLAAETCGMRLCESMDCASESAKETLFSGECTITHPAPLEQIQAEAPQDEASQIPSAIVPTDELPVDSQPWLPHEPAAPELAAAASCDFQMADDVPLEICPCDCEPTCASVLPEVEKVSTEVAPQPPPTNVEITVQMKQPRPLPTWNGPEVILVGNYDCCLGIESQTVGWQLDCAEEVPIDLDYPPGNAVSGVILH